MEHVPNKQVDNKILVDLVDSPIDGDSLRAWATVPACGAVVVFYGTARDHSVGRADVSKLEYEAYTEPAKARLRDVADEVFVRWPDVERVALVHRVGEVPLTESAVVVAVSSPHRSEAFEGARFAIDTLKSTVPIWKRETWADGESWGLEANDLTSVKPADNGHG